MLVGDEDSPPSYTLHEDEVTCLQAHSKAFRNRKCDKKRWSRQVVKKLTGERNRWRRERREGREKKKREERK